MAEALPLIPADSLSIWRKYIRDARHPGLMFGPFLDAWSEDSQDALLAIHPNDKVRVLQQVARCPVDGGILSALHARLDSYLRSAKGSGWVSMSCTARQATPLASRLGEAHPLENGFMFHPLYGVPFLPGSSVRGAMRAAWLWHRIDELNDPKAKLSDKYLGKADQGRARILFGGLKGEVAERRSLIRVLDAFPKGSFRLRPDVLNPHYKQYYEGNGPAAEWLDPVPIHFLTCAPGTAWVFRLLVAPQVEPQDRDTIREAMTAALMNFGLGAKKSSGYGLFEDLKWEP